jgi:hypothetical protein
MNSSSCIALLLIDVCDLILGVGYFHHVRVHLVQCWLMRANVGCSDSAMFFLGFLVMLWGLLLHILYIQRRPNQPHPRVCMNGGY